MKKKNLALPLCVCVCVCVCVCLCVWRYPAKKKKIWSCWYEENVTFTKQIFLPSPSLQSHILHAWPAVCDMNPWWSVRMSAFSCIQINRHGLNQNQQQPSLPTVSSSGGDGKKRKSRERQREENWILIRLDWRTEVVISNKGGGLKGSSVLSSLINTTYNLHILQLVCQRIRIAV